MAVTTATDSKVSESDSHFFNQLIKLASGYRHVIFVNIAFNS